MNDRGSNSSIYNEANFFSFPTSLFYLSVANIETLNILFMYILYKKVERKLIGMEDVEREKKKMNVY